MINDTVKPMGLDFTKDLHGHVRIELRDRWTGRVVDSQEKDNLVTNALQKIYKASRGSNTPLWNWFAPVYSKALGGLLLFDSALTESASNNLFTGEAKLVGFAGQATDTANSMAGNLNPQECVEGANSFASVWDFSTAQCNGTIASLARTSFRFPYSAIAGNVGSTVFNLDTMGPFKYSTVIMPLGYDATNKYLYIGLNSAQTVAGTTYPTSKIYRAYCDFEAQPLLNQYYIPDPGKWTEIITLNSSTDGSDSSRQFTYDPYSNNFYRGATGSTKKINLISLSGTRSTIAIPANLGSPTNMVATTNYYWYIGSDNKIYQVDKSNPSSTSSVSLTFTPERIVALNGDCIAAGNGSITFALVYSDMSVVYFDTFTQTANILRSTTNIDSCPPGLLDIFVAGTAPYWSGGTAYVRDPYPNTSYLGTIANLDSPVTKTSSQTMKITYTLTEA